VDRLEQDVDQAADDVVWAIEAIARAVREAQQTAADD
jgi:outer membrane murein-binding lipoprotein Lpp